MPKTSKRGADGRPATVKPRRGVCFRAVRGPDALGRWYWQGTRYEPITRHRYTFWCGWKHGADMSADAQELAQSAQDVIVQIDPRARSFAPIEREDTADGAQVYCMIVGGRYAKIGHSVNVWRRLSGIQTGLPYPVRLYALVAGGRDVEREIHKAIARYRVRGEWFYAVRPVLDLFDHARRAFERVIDARTGRGKMTTEAR